jgi:hypothetical protein
MQQNSSSDKNVSQTLDFWQNSRIGTGIGVHDTSSFKSWLIGGVIYWGLPIFIYFVIIMVIISLFLPLFRIVEKLG